MNNPAAARPQHAAASTSKPILFCDTETDGLTSPWLPTGRRIWEVAAIRREPTRTERHFHAFIRLDDLSFEPDDPGEARRVPLNIGGFYHRHPQIIGSPAATSHPDVYSYAAAANILTGPLIDRPILVGAVPSFDADSFLHLLHSVGDLANGQTPWAERVVCVWSLVAGRLGTPTDTLDRARVHHELGTDPSRYARHTALDDSRWARDVYDAVMSS